VLILRPFLGSQFWVTAFVVAMTKQKSNAFKPDELKHAFRVFARQEDGVPNGFIRRTTLEKALITYGFDRMTLDEARELLDQVRVFDHCDES
jgi:Ca2+-binding EF-hand superfamily protein